MAFDLVRGVVSGRSWARGGGADVVGVELAPPESGVKKMLAVGAAAGVTLVGGWLLLRSRKKPVRKSPSGRVYMGPLAGYYGKR